ncbi:MAG: hypothetical protein JSR34_01785 [Proteobacteria bacterium]|nr:hypothetical protein [Pseudomonadota bacterium]
MSTGSTVDAEHRSPPLDDLLDRGFMVIPEWMRSGRRKNTLPHREGKHSALLPARSIQTCRGMAQAVFTNPMVKTGFDRALKVAAGQIPQR